MRTAPAYALYLGGSENALLPRLLERLDADERTSTIVLVRTPEQAQQIRSLGLERLVIPERAVDARSLIAAADVLVSAGGTMNREAAVLGTPVWSMFEGRPGAVDDQLVAEGRLKMLAAPEDVVVAARPQPPVARYAGRDPGALLDQPSISSGASRSISSASRQRGGSSGSRSLWRRMPTGPEPDRRVARIAATFGDGRVDRKRWWPLAIIRRIATRSAAAPRPRPWKRVASDDVERDRR